jgi:hypothetical protein
VSKAEELLLKLIQLLTPLTGLAGGTSSSGTSLKIPIEGKIYVPQEPRAEALTRHPIRLLPPLQQIQKEMGQLMVALAGERVVETKRSEHPAVPRFVTPERAGLAISKSEGKQPFDGGSFFRSPKEQQTSSPLQKPAQKAIEEVKEVIRFLANPPKSVESTQKGLHLGLQQIQPSIDHLIESVKANPMMPAMPEKPSQAPLPEKPVSNLPIDRKTAAPISFSPKPFTPPTIPLPRTQEIPLTPERSAPGRLAPSPRERTEAPLLLEPKVVAPVPFQASFASLEHRLKRAKRTEKSLSWDEDEPEEKEKEEDS